MKYNISNGESINKLLEDFDDFHDSVIKRIAINFLDDVDLLGNIEIVIEFAKCSSYKGKERRHHKVIAHFKSVKNINFDFRGKDPIEWDIMATNIEKDTKPGIENSLFNFNVLYPKFVEKNGSWEKTEKEFELFLFKEAQFETDESSPVQECS